MITKYCKLKNMKESIAYKKAFELAVIVVRYCIRLKDEKKEFVMVRQLMKNRISIGANLVEVNGAHL